MAGEVAGFWSYVHADDACDGGRVLALSRKLRDEYQLQTGDEIDIFVDRESLEWGAEWNQRISSAIEGTTFFIPVITPRYFRSQECRRELLKFAREADRLGLKQLLMPVYWVSVVELENEPQLSSDEAISLVARFQWEDLREARLEDETSSSFRKAVARLAGELALRTARVATPAVGITSSDLVTEDAELEEEDDDRPGFLELVVSGEEAVAKLNQTLEALAAEINIVGMLANGATDQINAPDARTLGAKARLQIAENLAYELTGPAQNIERLGHEYASVLIALDPAVHAYLDIAETNEEGTVEESLIRNQFLKTVLGIAEVADGALRAIEVLVETMKGSAKISRSLRIPIRRIQTGLRGMLDGRALIEEWGRRATEIQDRIQSSGANSN